MKKDIGNYIEKECLRLFECGAINTADYEDNFVLPKIILSVALLNCADQYKPLHEKYLKEQKNLKNF